MNPLSSLVSRCCAYRIAIITTIKTGLACPEVETVDMEILQMMYGTISVHTPEFGLSDILAVPLFGPESELWQ